jgi:hypothetical protein
MVPSGLRKTWFTAALLAGFALLVAGWGAPAQADGGGALGFKVVGASYSQELVFASCMRRHGEPDFPDPNSKGVFASSTIETNTPEYQRAQKACQYLLPKLNPPTPAEQAKLLEKSLAFAKCMRSHGVLDFSDPIATKGGGISFSLVGVDPNSSPFRRAQEACQKLSPFPGGGPVAP